MRRLLSPRWIVRHVVVLLLVAGFLMLGWWQVTRASAGNTLSYAYAVEWPVFALFVIALWVREMRQDRRPAEGPAEGPAAAPDGPDRLAVAPTTRPPVVVPITSAALEGDDPDLAAYNDYLAWLAANPGRRPGEYRTAS